MRLPRGQPAQHGARVTPRGPRVRTWCTSRRIDCRQTSPTSAPEQHERPERVALAVDDLGAARAERRRHPAEQEPGVHPDDDARPSRGSRAPCRAARTAGRRRTRAPRVDAPHEEVEATHRQPTAADRNRSSVSAVDPGRQSHQRDHDRVRRRDQPRRQQPGLRIDVGQDRADRHEVDPGRDDRLPRQGGADNRTDDRLPLRPA